MVCIVPNEPVDVDEPLTNVAVPSENEAPPPAAREADVKIQQPNDIEVAEINPKEPVEVDVPRKSPLALISPVTVNSFVGFALPTPNLTP